MPHLIHVSRFHNHKSFNNVRYGTHDPKEFFSNASYDSYRERWIFDVSATYPHILYSHIQTVDEEDPCYLLDLRRYVERKAQGDVIYSNIDLTYKWCWNLKSAKGDWDRKYSNISHGYFVLNFENKDDLVMWRLMKPNLTTLETSKFNPRYDYHDEVNTTSY